jgi:hypothetical protein
MNLSNITQKMVTDWLRGVSTTPPTSLVFALSSTDPAMNGSGITEPPAPNGYARQVISFSPEIFVNGQGTTIKSAAPIVFGPCTNAPWAPINYVAIYSSTGQLLARGRTAAATVVNVGGTYSTALNDIQLLMR